MRMKHFMFSIAAAAVLSFTPASGTDWISIGVPRRGVRSAGVVAKVFENKADVVSAEWTVSGLGVFTAYVNGREIGADNALKPGFTDREKRRNSFSYDALPSLRRRAGEENVLSAVVASGWWSDNIIGRVRGRENAFWGSLRITYADGRFVDDLHDELSDGEA